MSVLCSARIRKLTANDGKGFHQPRRLIQQRASLGQMCHAAVVSSSSEPKPDDLQIGRIYLVRRVDPEPFARDFPFTAVGRSPSASEFDGSCDDPDGDAEFFT